MSQKALATAGTIVLMAAVLVSWGTSHWIGTRTFDPVDIPVSLEPGQIRSGEFKINLREIYGIYIDLDYSLNDAYDDGRCSFRKLIGPHWKVFRITPGSASRRELWAWSHELENGSLSDEFRGEPGRYELEWNAPAGSACLNARHPRLRVATPSDGYLEFEALAQYPCLFFGGVGAMLALRVLWSWLVAKFAPKQQVRMFPELVPRNLIARRWHRSMPPIWDMPNFGFAWGSVLYCLAIIFAMNTFPNAKGLLVDFRKPKFVAMEPNPWTHTTSVYVGVAKFYVNGRPIDRNELRAKLLESLGKGMVWTVYFEADPDCLFSDATYSIDTIQGLGAKVVWITPKMREEWNHPVLYPPLIVPRKPT